MHEGGLAGRSKAPREEIALKECLAYIPTAVSGGNRGVEGEGGALYETVPTTEYSLSFVFNTSLMKQ